MKKLISAIIVLILVIFSIGNVFASTSNEKYTLELEAKNLSSDCEIYLLLTKEYTLYAMEQDGMETNSKSEYSAAQLLKYQDIPSIKVEKDNVLTNSYIESDKEYAQILLKPSDKNLYTFDILTSYSKKDMKYRVKDSNNDRLMHIDNFTISNNTCKIEYDYAQNTIKQPDQMLLSLGSIVPIVAIVLIIILIIYLFVGRRGE